MKRKYFLRGLGSGILITTLILTISFNGRKDEIFEEGKKAAEAAQELEVTKSVTPTESAKATESVTPTESAKITENVTPTESAKATESVTLTAAPTVTNAATATVTPTVTVTPTATVAPTATNVPTATAAPTATKAPTKAPTVTESPVTTTAPNQSATKKITIVSGMWSDKVAQELQKLGLIQDAEDFDKYLIKNGYAERIRVGTFEIPTDASYEQIAKIITGR